MKPGNYQENKSPKYRYALALLALLLLGGSIYYAFLKDANSEEEGDTTDAPAYPVRTNTAAEAFTGNESINEMQQLILKKDERIVDLVNQLNMMKAQGLNQKSASPAIIEKPGDDHIIIRERDALKQQLEESAGKIPELNATISNLKKENEQLTLQISQSRSAVTGNNEETTKAIKNKNEQLETKLQAMDAELRFMKIDCNLSRADVNQIISNSRQRQALLSEALQTLNTLSRSEDAEVRNKAKKKFLQLETIAKTVRD